MIVMVRLTLPDGTVHLCPIADALALIADHPHVGVHTLEVCDVDDVLASPHASGVEATVPAGLGGTGRDQIAKWHKLMHDAQLKAEFLHDQYVRLVDVQAPSSEIAEAWRRFCLFRDDAEYAEREYERQCAMYRHPAGADL